MPCRQNRVVGLIVLAIIGSALHGDSCAARAETTSPAETTMRVYVGTYTGRNSQGIYQFDFDTATGKATQPELAGEAVNPSFLALAPNGKLLYSVSELTGGKKEGALNAFAIDPATGKLTLLNQQPSHGSGPCHVTVDHAGKFALATNYNSGSVTVLPINEDGSLGTSTAFDQHEGTGPNKARQEGPHAHFGQHGSVEPVCDRLRFGARQSFRLPSECRRNADAERSPPRRKFRPAAGLGILRFIQR